MMERLTSRSFWSRVLFAALFIAIWIVSRLIVATVVVLQVSFLLLSGAPNARLTTAGRSLAAYSAELVAYLTFATENQPFPFSAWPVGEAATPETQGDVPDTVPDGAGKNDHDSSSTSIKPLPPANEHSPETPPPPPPKNNVPQQPGGNANPNSRSNTSKSATRKSKRPRNIGGRRSQSGQPTSSRLSQKRETRKFRPEVICRKNAESLKWEIVLPAQGDNVREVHQNGELLREVNGLYHLSSFGSRLTVAAADGNSEDVDLHDGEVPLIFKLHKNWTGAGRKVASLTNGHFIVIAPSSWRRIGHIPVSPERCTDGGYLAHYFFQDENSSSEARGGFRKREIALGQPGFELRGKRVFDDSDDGELFVGEVPTLKTSELVTWARVGEEAEGGWKGENFQPETRELVDVLSGRQGRFFVRVYQANGELLDSGEFRYARDLEAISVDEIAYEKDTILFPSSTGYSSTRVSFIGGNGTEIRPTVPHASHHVSIDGDALVVDPHPDSDEVRCELKDTSGRVEVVFHLPRIWWCLEQDEKESPEWRDTPFVFSRKEFRDHAYANAAMLLRLPLRIKAVCVGFDGDVTRKYHRNGNVEDILIPLEDFVDYTQIDKPLRETASFLVKCDEVLLTLIRISADPLPEIISFDAEPVSVNTGEHATLLWETRHTEVGDVTIQPDIGKVEPSGSTEIAPDETTTYTLKLAKSGAKDESKCITVSVLEPPPPEALIVDSPLRTFETRIMNLPEIPVPAELANPQEMTFQQILDAADGTQVLLREHNIKVVGTVESVEMRETPSGEPERGRCISLSSRFPAPSSLDQLGIRVPRHQRLHIKVWISARRLSQHAVSISPFRP